MAYPGHQPYLDQAITSKAPTLDPALLAKLVPLLREIDHYAATIVNEDYAAFPTPSAAMALDSKRALLVEVCARRDALHVAALAADLIAVAIAQEAKLDPLS